MRTLTATDEYLNQSTAQSLNSTMRQDEYNGFMANDAETESQADDMDPLLTPRNSDIERILAATDNLLVSHFGRCMPGLEVSLISRGGL